MTLSTSDFDYDLPADRIAQDPAPRRDGSRLLVLSRSAGTMTDSVFSSIGEFLRPGDLLVANRSRVLPARVLARKSTGGEVEILLLRALTGRRWTALARPGRRLRAEMELVVPNGDLRITLIERLEEGVWIVELSGVDDIRAALRRIGSLPLPPYILSTTAPAERYQTVYGDREGSVAAPTAGLHFSDELLRRLEERGIATEFVTLHVGLGTFRPVTVDDVTQHTMHAEWGEVPQTVADAINATKRAGGRVIAVGTTTTRLLESAVKEDEVEPFSGETDIFIYPGYTFRAIDALVTNFHLPKSTLLMLVSALAGRDFIMRAYQHAVESGYRFYSFGDAMLILP